MFGNKKIKIESANARVNQYGYYEDDIQSMLDNDFSNWSLTNYKSGYAWLAKNGNAALVKQADATTKNADGRLYGACHTFPGKLKSTAQVESVGQRAFNNGGGCCTTSAYAAAFKLLNMGLGKQVFPGSRVEIVGQPGANNGHMWVLVNRQTGSLQKQSGGHLHPAAKPNQWGNYFIIDTWLMAFGWKGLWRTPLMGRHHTFIEQDQGKWEIYYDSNRAAGS